MPIKECPKRFTFNYQGKKRRGYVRKQEQFEYLKTKPKDYYKVAELLEWDEGGWSIRIGYYLKPHRAKDDKWQWGSQTTSIVSIENYDHLIKALTSLKQEYDRIQKERQTRKAMP